MKDLNVSPESMKLPGMAYAVAYPFGIIGIILTMLMIRTFFRISPQHEAEALEKLQNRGVEPLSSMNLELRNANLNGLKLCQIPTLANDGVVIFRILHNNVAQLAKADTILHPVM